MVVYVCKTPKMSSASNFFVNCAQLHIQNIDHTVVIELTWVLCVLILALICYWRIHS